jgi:hypothetical protein
MKLSEIILHTWEVCFAIGSIELSSKIESCMTDQKVSVIETFYSSGSSCVSVEKQYHQESSIHVAPSRGIVYENGFKKQEICMINM